MMRLIVLDAGSELRQVTGTCLIPFAFGQLFSYPFGIFWEPETNEASHLSHLLESRRFAIESRRTLSAVSGPPFF